MSLPRYVGHITMKRLPFVAFRLHHEPQQKGADDSDSDEGSGALTATSLADFAFAGSPPMPKETTLNNH
jgi:hypothetical protein